MDANEFNQHINYRPINDTKHLYHGSKNGIKGCIVPNYKRARTKVDFGQGFYLGDNATQAKTLVCNGRCDFQPVFYEIDIDLSKLRCARVDDLPWALFIAYNRGLMEKYENTPLYEQIAGIGDNQDVIIGPIADDRTSVVLEEFFRGTITDTALIACMGQLNLGTQYVLKTKEACDRINIASEHSLTPDEIQKLTIVSQQSRTEGSNLVETTKMRYRRIGEYFDEILEKGGAQFDTGYHK